MSATITKIKAVKFELGFSESEHIRAGSYQSWEHLNSAIRSAAGRMKPTELGLRKTDFTITFADGEVYNGRFDISAKDLSADVGNHIKEFAEFYAGRRIPDWMKKADSKDSLARWQAQLNSPDGQETAKQYGDFLDKYDIVSFGGSTGS